MMLQQAFDTALSRFNGENFEKLTETDQVLITVWGLEAEINNGGFDQYYFNSAGDQAWYAPTALRLIGAHAMAEIVERANSRFGSGGPPADRDRRQQELFEITDADETMWDKLDRQFQSYPDNLSELLTQYLRLRSVG